MKNSAVSVDKNKNVAVKSAKLSLDQVYGLVEIPKRLKGKSVKEMIKIVKKERFLKREFLDLAGSLKSNIKLSDSDLKKARSEFGHSWG